MPATNRSRDIVEHILRYCNYVETLSERHFDVRTSLLAIHGLSYGMTPLSICCMIREVISA